jgi:hypothetical protein
VLAGSDGGWWLPLLTGRQNSVPPMGYNSELDMAAPYRLQVHELASQVQTLGVDDPATLATMEEQGISYVYIGQKQGETNYAGPGRLDPQILLDSPHYRLVYHQDRVWIFEFLPPE